MSGQKIAVAPGELKARPEERLRMVAGLLAITLIDLRPTELTPWWLSRRLRLGRLHAQVLGPPAEIASS
ncbi:MAG TPA: hypothetical protein PKX32_05910 [Candidatus Saccharicenans sp.]|nr:hypothetical protein [Candidatus Saccharicenans sp.]